MQIFQRNILKKYIESLDAELIAERYQLFTDYFLDPERQENIHNSKEEQFQEGFLRELFVKILGYTLNPDPDFNLTTEKKNETNSKKADGAILVNGKVVGVVELKDHKTTDLSKVEAQAFNYKSQHKEAVYVVISNFEKLRFYIDNAVDFEEFDLFHLSREDFARLWICLAYDNITKNLPKQIKAASLTNEDQITNALYKDYSNFKRDLFDDILKNNPTDNTDHKILLFKKTQKLLDRLLFIFFAEDRGLLPPNSIMLIINQWEKLKDLDEYQPFYNRLKKYFGYMNTGFQGKNYEVFAYNGGLFKPDEILDGLTISDDVLWNYCKKISDYDFQSDVDVNILGHIFENSLTEIEEITNKLQQGEALTVSKRKKDGVFYTPQYITKYIVANTVGKLCNEKKVELGIDESEYFADKKRQVATKKALIEKLDAYRNWLLQISICDPACGSGAFLNAALDFLITEHTLIDEMQAKVEGAAIVFPNIENSILENNLYGVDINEESVEIAKLSLWLRTAKPHRKLNSLNNNIKCGNSLIDDPEIAGEKAFCWENEFPQVFEKGGFDVVIGNPPYVDIKQMDGTQADYLFNNFQTAENRINLYSVFIERGYCIVRTNGILSYINPNSMLINSSYIKLRKLIVEDLYDLIKLPDNVFEDAKVETIVFAVQKGCHIPSLTSIVYKNSTIINEIDRNASKVINKQTWLSQDDCAFNIYVNDEILTILGKIQYAKARLVEIADFSLGITPYDKYKGHSEDTIKNRRFHSTTAEDDTYKPLITGENVIRYYVSDTAKEYIKYGDWLGAPREERFFLEPRIIVRQIVSGNPLRIYAGYTDKPLYYTQIGFGIIPHTEYHPKYLLCLMNSWLMTFYHKYRYLDLEKELFQKILIANCKEFPIPIISFEAQQPFVVIADQMLSFIEQLQQKRQRFIHRLQESLGVQKITATLEHFDENDFKTFVAELKKQKISLSLTQKDEWEDYFNQYKTDCNTLSAQIAATDKEIDCMVYELYGLTADEIKVVEG